MASNELVSACGSRRSLFRWLRHLIGATGNAEAVTVVASKDDENKNALVAFMVTNEMMSS